MRDRFVPQLDVNTLLYWSGLDSREERSGSNDRRELLRAWQEALIRRGELEEEIQRLRTAADARNTRPATPSSQDSKTKPTPAPPPGDASRPEIPYPHLLSESELALLERLESSSVEDFESGVAALPEVAAIGSLPTFDYQGPFKRRISRIVARVVLFFTRFLVTQTLRSHEQLRAAVIDLQRQRDDDSRRLHQLGNALRLVVERGWEDLSHLKRLVEDQVDDLRAAQERVKEGLRHEMAEAFNPIERGLGRQFEMIDGQRIRLLEIECIQADLEARFAWMLLAADGTPTSEVAAGAAPLAGGRTRRRSPLKADLDALYLDFEDRFRGPRSLIRERLTDYLSLVEDCGAGTPQRPILDLGCGRGEWLELLAEKGYAARGVDSNQAAIHLCHLGGLDAELAEALEHLRSLETASVGMLTLFHVVEHLPFPTVVSLLDESFRTLVPGGVLLIETPNPENLTVGAYTFHIDPTHLAPLVPDYLAFLVGSRGFDRVRIERLSRGETQQLPTLSLDNSSAPALNPLIDRLNELLAASRDYAVVAFKPDPQS